MSTVNYPFYYANTTAPVPTTIITTNGTGNTAFRKNNGDLQVPGNVEIDGELVVQGKSLMKTLEKIEERLAILTPDPVDIEKWEALRKAYNHYKLMEKLVKSGGKSD